MYKCNIRARSRNNCCRARAISITYSECVSVTSDIQHAMRMHPIISPYVACLVLPHFFSTLSHKRYDFRKKKFTEHKIFVLSFYTTSSSSSFCRAPGS